MSSPLLTPSSAAQPANRPPMSMFSTAVNMGQLDIEKQASTTSLPERSIRVPSVNWEDRSPLGLQKTHSWTARAANILLQPFNMWAPLPDYDLEEKLAGHEDDRINRMMLKILVAAQKLRTQQWRVAYWTVIISLVCTIGTAFIGIATAVISFSDHSTAQKALSISLAAFGVILSLLKGSGQPGDAFQEFNKVNDIIDKIDDLHLSGPIDDDKIEGIKAVWRQVRDQNVTEQSTIWSKIENGGVDPSKTTKGGLPKRSGIILEKSITTAPVIAPVPSTSNSTTLSPPAPVAAPTSAPVTA